jgi:hypothetical protein
MAIDNRSISDGPNVFIGRITSSVNTGSLASIRLSIASHDRRDPLLPLWQNEWERIRQRNAKHHHEQFFTPYQAMVENKLAEVQLGPVFCGVVNSIITRAGRVG